MTDYSLLLWIIGGVLIFAGLGGMLLPFLPGPPILFAGLFCAAWAEDFRHVGLWTLLLLACMAALSYVVEYVATIIGPRNYGGSQRAVIGAAMGGIVGLFFGIPGILLGPFVGAVAGELSMLRSLKEAGRAGFGTIVGMAIGVAGKLAVGIAMVGLFLVVRLYAAF